MSKIKLTSALLAFVALLTVGGVFATFIYPTGAPDAVTGDLNLTLEGFKYDSTTPSEVLPSDSTADENGANHLNMVGNVTDGSGSGGLGSYLGWGGLNGSLGSQVTHPSPNRNVYSQESVTCTVSIFGIETKQTATVKGWIESKFLTDNTSTTNLEFVLTYESNTQYFCYTFVINSYTYTDENGEEITVNGLYEADGSTPNTGEYITVYRTFMENTAGEGEEDNWESVFSQAGTAKVVQVTVTDDSESGSSTFLTIDPATFTQTTN